MGARDAAPSSPDDPPDPAEGLDGVTVSLKRFFTLFPDDDGGEAVHEPDGADEDDGPETGEG